MKNLVNRKLFELFELFDKKVRNYSLFDKFLNPYLNPSLVRALPYLYRYFKLISFIGYNL
jgi:hypothetical protein